MRIFTRHPGRIASVFEVTFFMFNKDCKLVYIFLFVIYIAERYSLKTIEIEYWILKYEFIRTIEDPLRKIFDVVK